MSGDLDLTLSTLALFSASIFLAWFTASILPIVVATGAFGIAALAMLGDGE